MDFQLDLFQILQTLVGLAIVWGVFNVKGELKCIKQELIHLRMDNQDHETRIRALEKKGQPRNG